MIERLGSSKQTLVKCVPNLHMCKICTRASTRGSEVRQTKALFYGEDPRSWQSEPPRRSPSLPRRRSRVARPNNVIVTLRS